MCWGPVTPLFGQWDSIDEGKRLDVGFQFVYHTDKRQKKISIYMCQKYFVLPVLLISVIFPFSAIKINAVQKMHNKTVAASLSYLFLYWQGPAVNFALGSYDMATNARLTLLTAFTASGIIGLGTQRHYKYLEALQNFEVGT